MCDDIGGCVNTLFFCHVMSLDLPVVRRPKYTGMVRRQQACVDRIAGANVGGWMDHGLRGQKGNIFIYFFLFMFPLLWG